jgi:hypothetical protein
LALLKEILLICSFINTAENLNFIKKDFLKILIYIKNLNKKNKKNKKKTKKNKK